MCSICGNLFINCLIETQRKLLPAPCSVQLCSLLMCLGMP